MVCVCNDTYCDQLDDAAVTARDTNEIIVVSSSRVCLIFVISHIVVYFDQ